MSAAQPVPADDVAADRFVEGWRAGRNAARYVVWAVEGEAKPGAREGLALALARIDTLPSPPPAVFMPRATRLQNAIRAALALNAKEFTPEAIAIIEDVLK